MNLDRLSLPVRLAVLAMLVVALAVSAALYAAWRTTDARLTAQLDADLNTQQREWDRLVTANPPRDTAALLTTAGAWVREQQDHPARQLQAVAVTGGETRANTAWRSLADGADVTPLLQTGGPRDVRLADGSVCALPPREHDVLLGLAEGLSTSQVAARLGIGDATARGYVASAVRRLGVPDRATAVGLVRPPSVRSA